MNAQSPFRAARLSPFLLALLWLGCSSPMDPTTRPDLATGEVQQATGTTQGLSPSKGGFYPLGVGNQWSYRREATVRLITHGEPAPPPTTFVATFDREMACFETFNGIAYTTEVTREPTPAGLTMSWRRYRQDASGLYELDLPLDTPAACFIFPGERAAPEPSTRSAPTIWDRVVVRTAAERNAVEALRAKVATVEALERPGAGPALGLPVLQARPGELTRLRYPLRIKSRWFIRNDPGFRLTGEVASIDPLNLPAGRLVGHRIRLESPAYGPSGLVSMWYGPEGYLQTVAHFEFDIVDEGGNVTGIASFDQIEQLTDYTLFTPVAGFPPPLGGLPR